MKCFISSERISAKDRVPELYYYAIRHTDSGSLPYRGYTLERGVMVNHFADVVTDFEVEELKYTEDVPKPYMSVDKFFEKYQPDEVDILEDMYE